MTEVKPTDDKIVVGTADGGVETKTYPKPPLNIPALSGLRGVAALGVVFTHLLYGTGAKAYLGGWGGLSEMGHLSVVFFFVLSAYLLTVRPLNERQQPRDAKYVVWSHNGIHIPWLSGRWILFLIRRIFRIYPCYVFMLALVSVVPQFNKYYANLSTGAPLTPKIALQYVFFVDVNSIFWTIPPEFEYYLVLPFFVVLYEVAERRDKMGTWVMGLKKDPDWYPYGDGPAESSLNKKSRVSFIFFSFFRRASLLVILFVINWFVVPLFWVNRGAYDYYHLPPYMRTFWVGSVAAFLYHLCAQYGYVIPHDHTKCPRFSPTQALWIRRIADAGCWAIILVMFLSFPWYQKLLFHVKPSDDPNYYANSIGNLPDVLAALIIFLVSTAARNASFARFFEWSFFTWCGVVSFPLYLVHVLFIWLLSINMRTTGIDGLIFVIGSCILASTVIHYTVEKLGVHIGTTLARFVRERWFSKDPKSPSDIKEFEKTEMERYNERGLNFVAEETHSGSEDGRLPSYRTLSPGEPLINLTNDDVRDSLRGNGSAIRGSRSPPPHVDPNNVEIVIGRVR